MSRVKQSDRPARRHGEPGATRAAGGSRRGTARTVQDGTAHSSGTSTAKRSGAPAAKSSRKSAGKSSGKSSGTLSSKSAPKSTGKSTGKSAAKPTSERSSRWGREPATGQRSGRGASSARRRTDADPRATPERSVPADWEIVADEPWNTSRRARRRAERTASTEGRSRRIGGRTSKPRATDEPTSNRRGSTRPTAPGDRAPAGRAVRERGVARRSGSTTPATARQSGQRSGKQPEQQSGSGTNKQHQALQITPNQRGRTAKRRSDSRFSVGHSKPRLWAMIFLIGGVLILVLGQVIKMQTSGGDVLRAEGENQWSRHRVLPATRGTIFDRDGQEMAISIPAASVSIDPKRIEEPEQVMALLTEVVGIDADQQERVAAAIAAKNRSFVYVERQIPLEVGERLLKLVSNRGVKGIHVDWEDKRILPGGTTGQSVIGLTDIDGVGISGLELKYGGADKGTERGFTDVLSGTPGRSTRAIAPDGSTVIGTEQITAEPVPGRDLMLTIDRSVQYAVEQVLVEQVSKIGTKGGQVIVLDTKTGETIAMASVVRDADTDEVKVTARNSAAVDAYEPGSVVKAITVAAALNERTVTPQTTFTVPWRKQYADDWLRDAAQHPDQEMTVRDILVHSSNIGTIMIKEGMADVPEVARRIHWNYMREFGLGEKTAIDFPGESPGILKDWDELWGSERATVSYGQGVSSTSIQLIAAINVIANDGTYVVPSLVKGVIDESGKLEPAEPAATHEVVRPEVAQEMHSMMRSVVCSGTAKLAQQGIENYAVAGKTGTGYKAQPNGTYFNADGDYTYYASFVGFFPLEDPQITMLVSIDEPPADSVDRFGGTAAAPVFAELVPSIAQAMRIPPIPGSGSCDDPVAEQ